MKPGVNKALTVGVLVAVTGLAFLVAFTFFRKGGYSASDSYVAYAYFRDATGLTWKSRVQIAGIQVGEVSKITLEGDRARLELRIKKEIALHADACLTKSFPSALLPDALLEATTGSPGAPLLTSLPEDRREIACIRESTSVQQLLDSLAKISADVQTVTGDLAKTVGSREGSLRTIIENVSRITSQLDTLVSENGQNLSAIIANARSFTADLKSISGREKERIHDITVNVEQITRQLRDVLGSVKSILEGDGGGGGGGGGGGAGGRPFGTGPDLGVHALPAVAREPAAGSEGGEAVAQEGPGAGQAGGAAAPAGPDGRGIRQAVERLNSTLAKLDEIVGKVDEGKSAAGRILKDERMGRQLGNAVEGLSDYVDRLQKMQIEIQLRSEWLTNQSGAKAYFGGRLIPRPDKYYLFDVVSDPRGVNTITTTTTVSGGTTNVSTTTVHEEKLTFSLQFAKRYGPLAFRVGIIESSGGVGADFFAFHDRLQLSTSVYQFNRPSQSPDGSYQSPPYPRAKVYLNYSLLQHFYVTVGADDFLNKFKTGRYPGGPRFAIGNDVFFGGGIFFTDDDIKTLLMSGAGSAASAAGSGQ